MSNAIRYDSLLVRELARELHGRLAGRHAHALLLDRDRATVSLRTGHEAIVFELDPLRGHIRFESDVGRWSGNVPLPRAAVVSNVSSPPDERVLAFHFDSGDEPAAGARTLIIELVAPRWNAIALGDDGRIHALLRARQAGVRPLVAGGLYQPLAPTNRAGTDQPISLSEWRALFDRVEPADRTRVLLTRIAWTSPLNAEHILRDDALDDAHARYIDLAAECTAPALLAMPHGPQPYPFPLSTAPGHPQPSLLAAFEEAARQQPALHAGAAPLDIERIRRHRAKVDARIEHLRKELADAPAQAETLRRNADLLLAQLHHVHKGESEARLDDFAGSIVTVTLDPALAPADNARAMYAAARKRTRAAARLPAMIARAEREASRLADLVTRMESGEATAEEVGVRTPRATAHTRAQAPRLPYHRYRTSGGLEVRVGRGAAANDELTFHHSTPDDIWMHARDVGGAHVVLRWNDRDANPAASDLAEAASLAALYSRARTSRTVPVDWTRRKYVRKPRKAKPGLVMVERTKTIFVQPSEELKKRLREEEPGS